MDDLSEIVRRYSIKQDRLIKKICAPLADTLGISYFAYYRIEEEGGFCIVSNLPEQLDYYYSQPFYLTNPYLVHPRLMRTGYAIVTTSFDEASIALMRQQFNIYKLFLILQHFGGAIEGYLFFGKESDPIIPQDFLNNLHLLLKFAPYFKREAKTLLGHMQADKFNLKKAKGEAFLKSDPNMPLAYADQKTLTFLKKIAPLSWREQQCLELFQQGRSAQATAGELGLSPRTVESYFESIKDKLGCYTKGELLEW